MFKAMLQCLSGRSRIIGRPLLALALVLGLAACSAVRLGYNQANHAAYWWLDGYADFNDEQRPRVKAAIDDWFAWHRRDQLPRYAALLERAQAQVGDELTPAAVCAWRDELRQAGERAFEQAVPALAAVAATLAPAQLEHVERRMAKADKKFRDEHLQADPRERLRERVKRTVERSEMLYGRLSDAQRALVERRAAESPYDPALARAERAARNQDLLAALRELPRLAAGERETRLRSIGHGFEKSPRPAYRAYQDKLNRYNCAFLAELHNSTAAAQRQHARERLRGWQEDARALSSGEAAGRPLNDRSARSPDAG